MINKTCLNLYLKIIYISKPKTYLSFSTYSIWTTFIIYFFLAWHGLWLFLSCFWVCHWPPGCLSNRQRVSVSEARRWPLHRLLHWQGMALGGSWSCPEETSTFLSHPGDVWITPCLIGNMKQGIMKDRWRVESGAEWKSCPSCLCPAFIQTFLQRQNSLLNSLSDLYIDPGKTHTYDQMVVSLYLLIIFENWKFPRYNF